MFAYLLFILYFQNSLMDQDLSLMKQLLVLNETIEELKWKRRCSYDSMPDSSAELDVSDWSLSDNDLFESCDDVCKKSQHGETEVPEVTSLANAIKHKCTTHESHIPTKKIEKKSEKIYKFKIENAIYKQTSEEDQSSCDSGICDSFLEECSWTWSSIYTVKLQYWCVSRLCSALKWWSSTLHKWCCAYWSLHSQDIIS